MRLTWNHEQYTFFIVQHFVRHNLNDLSLRTFWFFTRGSFHLFQFTCLNEIILSEHMFHIISIVYWNQKRTYILNVLNVWIFQQFSSPDILADLTKKSLDLLWLILTCFGLIWPLNDLPNLELFPVFDKNNKLI